jgi:phage host-nuclease inhibitor protein Gam
VLDFRMNYVEKQLKRLETEMKNSSPEEQVRLMPQLMNLREIRNILAKRLGKNLVYTL